MYNQRESGGVILIDPETDQRRDHHEMPWPDTALNRNGHADTAHRKGDQPDGNPQITCEIKRVKRDIEITKVTAPNQQRIQKETPFLLHQPDAFHAHPDISQHPAHLFDQRKVTHIFKYKPNRQP